MTQDHLTLRKLADTTDAGDFERLVTAILRRADFRCRSLCHPGVNADGKTVKSPVDGIAFVPGADPPQMIVVHHTICSAKDLPGKWLHDPALVQPKRKGKKPTQPAGDVIKTIAIVEDERKRTPGVRALLILTTNQEPGHDLLRDVNAAAVAAGIEIDVWARSRLADLLDHEAWGQELRRQLLGIDQTLLSAGLLKELSKQNLRLHRPPDNPAAWVHRRLDEDIAGAGTKEIIFVVAESGSGKSIACYRRLLTNEAAGGFSLVLTDEQITSSASLEQTVGTALLQLCPSLAPDCGNAALQLANSGCPLLLLAEDVNRSGRGTALVEKIARWARNNTDAAVASSWQLLCPIWPSIATSLTDETRKKIDKGAVIGTAFTEDEGAKAVARRRQLDGQSISALEAERVSAALGHDPLLIALFDPSNTPDTTQTISQFIESSLQRLAATRADHSASEYRQALVSVATAMMLNRQLEPHWLELLAWPTLRNHSGALRNLVHQGEVIRLVGVSKDEKLAFRHDRVREWLLVQAALDLICTGDMPADIVADPYYAEIFGLALAHDGLPQDAIARFIACNPLALFCSVRHFHQVDETRRNAILAALEPWLVRLSRPAPEDQCLYWEASRALADAEGPNVLPIIARINSNSWNILRARYRNGDLGGGIGLCLHTEPGITVIGHDAFLDHVKARFGNDLVRALVTLLERPRFENGSRIGALRLAGYIGDPALADAVRACWRNDEHRDENLREYLWAASQCVDDDPETLLGPVCDGWAALPATREAVGMPSARDDLAANELKWAFRNRLPVGAIRYFIARATGPEIRWPMTYMLQGLDQPDAIEFITRELAATNERLEGTNSFSHFSLTADDDWKRRGEGTGRIMSDVSRERLMGLCQDKFAGKHLREQAFRTWAASARNGDLALMREIGDTETFSDTALWRRLELGDGQAIPHLINKLQSHNNMHWWHLGAHVWSDDLTEALDRALERRGAVLAAAGGHAPQLADSDRILAEMIMRRPIAEATAVLGKHWDRLHVSHYYVIAALYVATPSLLTRVATTVGAAREPKELFKHLTIRLGHRLSGHPGLVRPEQIEALLPYLDLFEDSEISSLWDACNRRGWFALRRAHLDGRLPANVRGWAYLSETRVIEALNQLAARRDRFLDHWVDEFLATGVTASDIMAIVARWLHARRDLAALEVARAVILHIGERRHLDMLRAEEFEPPDTAAAIIADTEFALKRRTLRT